MDNGLVDEVRRTIEDILAKKFSDSVRRKVVAYSDRLNFACPYCGDSTQSVYKKRGNLYLTDMGFHCFNCGKHRSYIGLLKDFGESLPMSRMNDILAISSEKKYQRRERSVLDLSVLKTLDGLAVTRKSLRDSFRLSEITPASPIYKYLVGRGLEGCLPNFMYSMRNNELFVLNLNRESNVVGLQIRSFDENKTKYRTYNISRIYKLMGRELGNVGDIDVVDSMSIVYNILLVDLLRPLYVFEGGIDSFFLPNSIGICGVKRQVEAIGEIPSNRYFFDNDKSGMQQTVENMKAGKYVFLWDKFLTENGIDGKIKDFNDLVCWVRKNRPKFDLFGSVDEYFSNDLFDIALL